MTPRHVQKLSTHTPSKPNQEEATEAFLAGLAALEKEAWERKQEILSSSQSEDCAFRSAYRITH
jgi:hypothetical protein